MLATTFIFAQSRLETPLQYTNPTQTKAWMDNARFGIYLDWTERVNFDPETVKNAPYDWGIIRLRYKNAIYGELRDEAEHTTGRRKWEEWNPSDFNATAWINTFVDSGAQFLTYEIIDDYGFTMCDSPGTTLDIAGTVFGKDVCSLLGKAAQKQNLPMLWHQRQYGGIDYILKPWNYFLSRLTMDTPRYPQFRKKTLYHIIEHPEIYGKAAGIVFAGNEGGKTISEHPAREGDYEYQFDQNHSDYIQKLLEAQPWLIFSTRFVLKGDPYYKADFEFENMKFANYNKHLETDETMRITLFAMESDLDGWSGGRVQDSRTAYELIKMLVFAAVRDNNFAVRVTPDPKGNIPDYQKERLHTIGTWLQKYGESIYSTRNGPYMPGSWGGATRKGNKIYLHLTQNSESGEFHFPKLPDGIQSVKLLNNGATLNFTNDANGFNFHIDSTITTNRKEPDRVVEITYNNDVDTLKMETIDDESIIYHESLCKGASVETTSNSAIKKLKDPSVLTERLLDDKGSAVKYLYPKTAWSAKEPFEGDDAPKSDVNVTVDFGKTLQFDQVTILEKHNRIRDWSVEYLDTNNTWHTIYSATNEPIAFFEWKLAQPIRADKLRVQMHRFEGGAPQLRAIRVFMSP